VFGDKLVYLNQILPLLLKIPLKHLPPHPPPIHLHQILTKRLRRPIQSRPRTQIIHNYQEHVVENTVIRIGVEYEVEGVEECLF